ncbi:signal peptidase I [Mucilaginibacter aquaedulcis]|uniref:signal peptidase I n=1 Tax=Mucilaginibacter aquaedulcis TaxID=1187081 RepID=UPI0025B5A6C0|nr:signal peptidase I [Mucilaginibacter aquaedulcis]MDN3548805.1 signal peptidase I [Mucilaginibacter aquaedulcis]
MSKFSKIFLVFSLITGGVVFGTLDFYKVPTGSMQPSIKPGDYIIIDNLPNYFRSSALHAFFLGKIKKDDIYVFYQPRWDSVGQQSGHSFLGDVMVKRCTGLPGDTVIIDKPSVSSISGYPSRVKNQSFDLSIYPHDSTFNWTYNKIGPLLIPKKGSRIKLSLKMIKLYGRIMNYEGVTVLNNNDCFYLNGKKQEYYTFLNDYYFMLGDNFYGSKDSRLWGLVPQNNLIGQVVMIF